MKHALAAISLLVSLVCVSTAQSQAPAWSQCGGQGWTGPTTCVSGYSCVYSNPYYSQCLPGSVSSTSSTVTVTTTPNQPTTTTSTGPAPTGSQIRTVQDPVYHFYLQSNGGVPVLGPESSSGRFTISGSISLNNANGTKQYLNVDSSGTASYKALTLGSAASTTNWGLEGDTIIITNPRQLNFLACGSTNPSFYDVYLQQGNDMPPGKSCTMVTLHLPCLC